MSPDPEPRSTVFLFLLLALGLTLLAAFYAAAGAALDRLSPGALRRDAENGDKKARTLSSLVSAQSGTVSPVDVGLCFCAVLGGVFFTAGLYPLLLPAFSAFAGGMLGAFLSCLLPAVLYLPVFSVLGDLLPKKLARLGSERFAKACATPIRVLSAAASPLLWLSAAVVDGVLRLFRVDPKLREDAVTEEEILQMVDEGEEKGVLEETEKDMIANILDFNDTTVEETMTHRKDITAIADTASIGELAALSVESGCSRVPVYHGDIDSVVGICYVKDLLPFVGRAVPEESALTDFMRPAYFIPETKKCSQLFTEMTERKVQIAIAVDEYGGTAGLITLEDLVESIVGNIQDEYDNEEEEFHRLSERAFTVDGAASIDEITDLTGVALPEGDYDTLAGFVTDRLGRIPHRGERPSVTENGLTITVLEVSDQRLAKLLVVREPRPEEQENA